MWTTTSTTYKATFELDGLSKPNYATQRKVKTALSRKKSLGSDDSPPRVPLGSGLQQQQRAKEFIRADSFSSAAGIAPTSSANISSLGSVVKYRSNSSNATIDGKNFLSHRLRLEALDGRIGVGIDEGTSTSSSSPSSCVGDNPCDLPVDQTNSLELSLRRGQCDSLDYSSVEPMKEPTNEDELKADDSNEGKLIFEAY